MDMRNNKLAKVLVNYSTKIKKGEKVLIDCIGKQTVELLENIVQEVIKVGGIPVEKTW